LSLIVSRTVRFISSVQVNGMRKAVSTADVVQVAHHSASARHP